MRKCVFSFALGAVVMFLVLVILANLHARTEQKSQQTILEEYVSSIEKDDCFLCGAGKGKVSYSYWGEDNIGILNLNTLDLLHLEINRYDDRGELVSGQAGYMSSTAISDSKTGSSAHAFVFPDEGFAHLQISKAQYKIDRYAIQNNLCQSCLDSINDWSHVAPVSEYAVISFQDQTIHPLTQSLPWFSTGNYGVNCEYGDEIKLLVHYLQNNK